MSNISTVWRRPYVLRSYGEQQVVKGHAVNSFTDKIVWLDVQFLSQKEMTLLPEGKRSTAGIKTYGSDVIRTVHDDDGVPADKLFYQGNWWECVASVIRDKTVLAHCRAQFIRVPNTGEEPEPTIQPTEEDEEEHNDYRGT